MPLCLAEPVVKIHCPDFDLAQTLDCGQCFRWEMLEDGSFSGIAFGKYCRVTQEGDTISFFDTTPEDFNALWRSYFDLDRDYGALKERLSQNPFWPKPPALHPVSAFFTRITGKPCAPLSSARTTTLSGSKDWSAGYASNLENR